MPESRPLDLVCPRCGGVEIVYSCEPECCFNHLCGGCRTTFLTATRYLGARLPAPPPRPGGDEPDPSDPAAPCCECGEAGVVRLADGRCSCVECGALLELLYEEISDRPPPS